MAIGLVVETQRRHYIVNIDGETIRCVSKGRDQSIACGDLANVTLQPNAQGVIETVSPRTSKFYRADAFKQKVVAANVTQVVCVIAADPTYSPALLDRWLVTAQAADVRVVIVLNKMDLTKIAPQVLAHLNAQYATLGYSVIGLCAHENVDALRPLLAGQRSVLIGQSGMGKSSILNQLFGEEIRKIGPLSILRNAGTHTTTHSKLFALDAQSWIIDSPGMQVFGVAHLTRADVVRGFPELARLKSACRFRNCAHRQEPDCVVKDAVKSGVIAPSRFQHLLELFTEVGD